MVYQVPFTQSNIPGSLISPCHDWSSPTIVNYGGDILFTLKPLVDSLMNHPSWENWRLIKMMRQSTLPPEGLLFLELFLLFWGTYIFVSMVQVSVLNGIAELEAFQML